tara:strand:+ start:269 stop:925 length:657 start_codon:yes stop_codon:yes gene_type:complete
MSPFTKNIPNILTISRIILAPIFFILFVYDYIHLALLCFLTASVTDALDGFIARKFNVVSKFGELYDPLADKILVFLGWVCIFINPPFNQNIFYDFNYLTIFFSKAIETDPNYMIFFILLLLLLRDLIATTMREEKFRKDNIILKTNYLAKSKTTMLIVCIHFFIMTNSPFILNNKNMLNYNVYEYLLMLFDISLYVTLFLSFTSLIDYFKQYKSKKI